MSEPNDRDYRKEYDNDIDVTYLYEERRLDDGGDKYIIKERWVEELLKELEQTRKERDQWINAHNMVVEGNHVVILERDDYKLQVETMPTLEEYNDVCSALSQCKKERDAKFSIEEVEKAFIVFLRKEHYQEIVLVAKEFKKNLLKSKEEKED